MAEISLREVEVDGNSPFEYDEAWLAQGTGWTAEQLGITFGVKNEGQAYTRQDFYGDLRKVSRRQNIPIGENIRDAIRSIRGK